MSAPGNLMRAPKPSDQSYIAASWVKQLASYDRAGAVGARYGQHGRNVDALLDRGDTRAMVRHAPGDADAIRGWIVYAEGPGVPLVHYVYLRKGFREQGLATQLLRQVGVLPDTSFVVTARSSLGDKLLRNYRKAAYMPLADFLR